MRTKIKTRINNKKARTANEGYVLIDVVVTLFIMTIAFISLLSGFASVGRIAGQTFQKAKQIVVDQNELDKIPRFTVSGSP
jgi:hypothetical protein